MEISLDHLRSTINDGLWIKWVGYHSPRRVWVHTYDIYEKETRYIVHLQEDYTEEGFRQIYSSSASEPGTNTGTIWSSGSRLELLRLASILGVNLGGKCIPGCGREYHGEVGCIMAYDIESDRTRIPASSFGTLSESILSIATYCSCGDTRVFSFLPNVDFDYILSRDSRDTVSKFIHYVSLHSPQWLLGYNNFGYDNTRIAFHADPEFDSILIPMRVGSGSSLTYAFYLDIQGVYNADLMTYLDKTRRSQYQNMSLATVAKYHGMEKMDFDTADVRDFKRLFEYNLHDCKITMELAIKSSAIDEIKSLCTVACVPAIDSVRFVTGTFAACSIASYCLDKRISMDWSPCSNVVEYRGAEVLQPVLGMHENVVSCDFSSMYPTILLGANISIENCSVARCTLKEGSTWSSRSSSNFVINSLKVSFDMKCDSIVPPVMSLFVNKRRPIKKSNPPLANALKVSANSIYGSLGDRNSRIYSPNCSAAVTTGGRWCLATAETVIQKFGWKVVYGDTDSCFVAPTSSAKCSIEILMSILYRIFLHTPFAGMSMEVENRYSKIALLGKKTYFGRMGEDRMISKGMSGSRKDRVGVCRKLSAHIIPLLLSDYERKMKQEIIANMVSSMIEMSISGSLSLIDVSKIIKRGGSNYYEYTMVDGKRDTLECESTSESTVVAYSPKTISSLVVKEMDSLFRVASIGSFSQVMRWASIF